MDRTVKKENRKPALPSFRPASTPSSTPSSSTQNPLITHTPPRPKTKSKTILEHHYVQTTSFNSAPRDTNSEQLKQTVEKYEKRIVPKLLDNQTSLKYTIKHLRDVYERCNNIYLETCEVLKNHKTQLEDEQQKSNYLLLQVEHERDRINDLETDLTFFKQTLTQTKRDLTLSEENLADAQAKLQPFESAKDALEVENARLRKEKDGEFNLVIQSLQQQLAEQTRAHEREKTRAAVLEITLQTTLQKYAEDQEASDKACETEKTRADALEATLHTTLQQHESTLQTTLQQHAEQLNAHEEEKARVGTLETTLQSTLQQHKITLQKLAEQTKICEDEKARADALEVTLQSTLQQYVEQKDTQEDEKARANALEVTLQNTLQKHAEQIKIYEDEKTRADALEATLHTTLQKHETTSQQHAEQISSYKDEKTRADALEATLQTTLQDHAQDQEAFDKATTAFETELTKLKAEYKNLHIENVNIKAEHWNLQAESRNLQMSLDAMNRKFNIADQAYQNLFDVNTKEMNDLKDDLAYSLETRASLLEECIRKRDDLNEARKEVEQCEETVNNMSIEMRQAKDLAVYLSEELDKTKEAHEHLRKVFRETIRRLKETEQTLEDYKITHQDANENHRILNIICTLRWKNQQLNAIIDDEMRIKKEIQQCQAHHTSMKEEYDGLMVRLKILFEQVQADAKEKQRLADLLRRQTEINVDTQFQLKQAINDYQELLAESRGSQKENQILSINGQLQIPTDKASLAGQVSKPF